jgi:hypothetical protein
MTAEPRAMTEIMSVVTLRAKFENVILQATDKKFISVGVGLHIRVTFGRTSDIRVS